MRNIILDGCHGTPMPHNLEQRTLLNIEYELHYGLLQAMKIENDKSSFDDIVGLANITSVIEKISSRNRFKR